MSDAGDRAGPASRLERYIRERMAAQGIVGVRELSRRAPVEPQTIYSWFAGHRPSAPAGTRVANALGVRYEDLLAARDGRPPRPSDEQEAMVERVAERVARRLLAELRAAQEERRDG